MADARFRWGAWFGAMGLALVAAPAAAQSQPAQVTFTKDIAPIFQKACESCHRQDSIAPMSLVTYEEARPWARSIGARGRAPDAALAHRQERRHPALQERPLAERRRKSTRS